MKGNIGTVYHKLGESPCAAVALLIDLSGGTEALLGDTGWEVELNDANVDVGEVEPDIAFWLPVPSTRAKAGGGGFV